MPRVYLPVAARGLAGGIESVEVVGGRVLDLIDELERQFPGVKARLCAGNRLQPGIAAVINGSVASLGALQPVPESAEVHFLPALGGG